MKFVLLTILTFSLLILLPGCQPAQPPPPVDQRATLAVLMETLEARMQPTSTSTPRAVAMVRDFVPRTGSTSAPTTGPRATATPSLMPSAAVTRKPTQERLPPESWREWPIIPELSTRSLKRYQVGQEMGLNADVFSVVGDCQSEPEVFLGVYDRGGYELGEEYAYLQETIDFYKGSFFYYSPSVADGLNVSSALSPDWADKSVCLPGESPVACELRLRRPAIVLVNLGTNWGGSSIDRYEHWLRLIVDMILDTGALPVLSTKVDNVEGDHGINLATARVAYDYDLPLWNFWRAAQVLSNGGLSSWDNKHLSVQAWNMHSFSALQVLDALRKNVADE